MNKSENTPNITSSSNDVFKVFEEAYHASEVPTFGLGVTGNIIFWNEAMLNLTDYYPEEAMGKHYSDFFEIFHYEDSFTLKGLLQNLTGKAKRRNGTELQIKTGGIPVQSNGIEHVYLTIQNITKETFHVQELVKNNILMKELFSSSREMVVVFNRKGTISFASEPFKNLVRMTDAELRRTTFIDLIPKNHRTRLLVGLKMAEETQEEHKMELTIENESQKRITDCHISYKEESTNCYRLHLFDITDKKRKELEQEVSITFAKLLQENFKIQELYEKAYLAMKLVVDMDSFLLLRLRVSGQGMYIPFHSTNVSNLKEETIPASEFALAMVNVLNRPMFMYKEVIEKLAKQYNIKLINTPEIWMGLPLITNNQKMGMIVVQSFVDRKAFSKPDLNLFDLATGMLAAAIIRDQSQLKVRAQRAQLEAIFESGAQAIWTFNKAGLVTRYNQQFAEYIKQYSNIELMPGMLLNNIIPFTPRFEEHWDQILKRVFDGESISFEYKFMTFTDKEQWHSISLNPVRMQSGDGEIIQEIAGVTQNITQRKKMELHIADSEELFRNIFETLQDVYFRTDLKGNFTLISPSVKDMLGEKQTDIIDKHVTEYYISESDLSRLMKILAIKGAVKNHESIVRKKNGEVRYILSNFRLIYDKKKQPVGVEGLARDISPIKKSEHELREAKDLAEKSLEVKRQFLSNMSHEIRTPMNGVIGMVDLLSTTELSQEQKKYVSTIKRSSEILLNILNDILDLSKIEAGKMELRPLPIDLRVTISKLIALFHQNAKNKNTQLSSNVSESVPSVILADETRLLQILSNLTSNAIKFTENGTVTINVNGVQKFNGIYTLMFDVVDTGCGISKKSQEHLFKQFSQVEDSYNRTKGGTGLGLSISQELCNMMDGDIGVESELDVGSTFWFTIEIKEVQHLPPTNNSVETQELFSPKIRSTQPNILVVDDNSVNVMVAESILKKAGCKTTAANSGFRAIELLEDGNVYDIIFMDIQMPKMNGMETTRRIHTQFKEFTTPIIAMTAFTLVEEQNEFLEAGMDGFLPKPIKAFDLLQKVEELINESRSASLKEKVTEDKAEVIEIEEEISDLSETDDDTPRTDKELDNTGHVIIDYAVTAELAKYGGVELIQLSFEDFINEGDTLIHELVEAKNKQSVEDIRSIMHTFKGTAATIGIMKLSEKAKISEQKLKGNDLTNMNEDIDDIFSLYHEFKSVWDKNLGD